MARSSKGGCGHLLKRTAMWRRTYWGRPWCGAMEAAESDSCTLPFDLECQQSESKRHKQKLSAFHISTYSFRHTLALRPLRPSRSGSFSSFGHIIESPSRRRSRIIDHRSSLKPLYYSMLPVLASRVIASPTAARARLL